MNWNRRGLVRDANFFIIVNLIWIFLSFYTSISAIHDIVQAYHASADRQTLIHHACIACEWAGASAWLFGAVLFWIQIIKKWLCMAKMKLKQNFQWAMKLREKKTNWNKFHTHQSKVMVLHCGSEVVRRANSTIWIRIAVNVFMQINLFFYLPCKFTVQVVLLPRSNTTTLVAAAIVSARLVVIVRSLVHELISLLEFQFSLKYLN